MSILLRSPLFMRLTTFIAITTFVSGGTGQIQLFYLNTILGFNEKDTSKLLLIIGIGSIVAQFVFLRPFMVCGQEKGVIMVAIMSRMWNVEPTCLGTLSFAATSSLKSINCSDHEQGRLRGAIYSIRGVFEATGPVVFAFLYNMMKKDVVWTQLVPYVIAMVLYGGSALVAMYLPSPTN